MNRLTVLFATLVFVSGCKKDESVITIVDVGKNNRAEIAQQLSIINKHSPKVLALDFFLTNDSLKRR